jgi:hypothetical protein
MDGIEGKRGRGRFYRSVKGSWLALEEDVYARMSNKLGR